MKEITVYTDGSCIGNPGPMGIAFILQYNGHQLQAARYMGNGTNNRAELLAAIEALKRIKNKDIPLRLYTDSTLVQGILEWNWKAKKNLDLVKELKKLAAQFKDFRVIKVDAHADDELNNAVDELARKAARNHNFEVRK